MTDLGLSPPAWVVLSYLVGAIPVGLLIARSRGVDLRSVGSGNIGATNAVRAMGSRWGLLVFALDALKAMIPVYLAAQALPPWWVTACGFAAVLGHMFPIYLKLRGGKGVACGFGVLLALDTVVAAGGIVLYALGLALTRRSAVGSLTAVTAMAVTVLVIDRPTAEQSLVVGLAALIWLRHHANVRDLLRETRDRSGKADG